MASAAGDTNRCGGAIPRAKFVSPTSEEVGHPIMQAGSLRYGALDKPPVVRFAQERNRSAWRTLRDGTGETPVVRCAWSAWRTLQLIADC